MRHLRRKNLSKNGEQQLQLQTTNSRVSSSSKFFRYSSILIKSQLIPSFSQIEPRYSSPPSSQRSSGYGSVASSYQQSSLSRYEAPQQYANYTNQAAYGQSSAASSVSSRQYPAKAQGFYESSANSRYY